MQTTIDLPEPQLEALNALAKARNQTPSEFLAEVLSGVLAPLHQSPAEPLSWENMDGLEYERKIRAEWDREWDRQQP